MNRRPVAMLTIAMTAAIIGAASVRELSPREQVITNANDHHRRQRLGNPRKRGRIGGTTTHRSYWPKQSNHTNCNQSREEDRRVRQMARARLKGRTLYGAYQDMHLAGAIVKAQEGYRNVRGRAPTVGELVEVMVFL